MSILGMDSCNNQLLHHGMFLSGGPGKALSEILSLGGDSRALLTIRKIIPADLAIAKAVAIKDPRMLARVFAIWDSCQSDTGLYASMIEDFRFGVDNIACNPSTKEYMVGYRNMYYLIKGVLDRIDESIDKPYKEYIPVYLGLSINDTVYDKLYPCTSNWGKLQLAAKMGRMRDFYCLLDTGTANLDGIRQVMDYLSVDRVIDIYNKYKHMYDLEKCIVGLCMKISTLEELAEIDDKDNSDGYTQATRYFMGISGYIHPMLTASAIDTHRDGVLDNIIRYANQEDYVEIVSTMDIKGWTLDMILEKISIEVLCTGETSFGLRVENRVELINRGILQLEDLGNIGYLKGSSLKSMNHDIALYVIRNAYQIYPDSIEVLLWIWHNFGLEVEVEADIDDTYNADMGISRGKWVYHGDYQWAFMTPAPKLSRERIDVYLCWRAYMP